MVWYFIWPAPHPKYVHPPGTNNNFSHLRVNPDFQQKFFKTPYVPNGCIYWSTVLGREDQVSKVSFDIILSKKIFRKNFQIFFRNDSKTKNRFSTLTTTTVESTFTNKLHISLSTICHDDVIKENDVIGYSEEIICNHDEVLL